MCAVIFGYMYFFGPSEAELAEQQRQQDSIAAVQQAAKTAPAGTAIDVLTADEVAQIKNLLTGAAGDSTRLTAIDRDGVRITLNGGDLDGTITMGDTNFNFNEALTATSAAPVPQGPGELCEKRLVCQFPHG